MHMRRYFLNLSSFSISFRTLRILSRVNPITINRIEMKIKVYSGKFISFDLVLSVGVTLQVWFYLQCPGPLATPQWF